MKRQADGIARDPQFRKELLREGRGVLARRRSRHRQGASSRLRQRDNRLEELSELASTAAKCRRFTWADPGVPTYA